MNGARTGRKRNWMVGALAALLLAGTPVAAAEMVAVPVGVSGSTVYITVTNASLEPAAAKVTVSMISNSTTIVGSTSVALAPMSSATVPVSMSGTVSKLSLSSSVQVSVIDNQDPFCY